MTQSQETKVAAPPSAAAKPAAVPTKSAKDILRERLSVLSTGITGRKPTLAGLLPKHVNIDRFLNTALVAVSEKPELLACTPESVFKALNTAATLGLDFSGTLGSAYLIPFKDNNTKETICQLMPGYRGLAALAIQSGYVSKIDTFIVRSDDVFECELGTSPKIVHKPNFEKQGEFRLVYAVAHLTSGGFTFCAPMNRAQVDAVRARSKAAGSGPWVTDWEAMAMKTAIRRLIKMLPTSTERLARALEVDDAVDHGVEPKPEILDAVTLETVAVDNMKKAESVGALGMIDAALAQKTPESNGGLNGLD